MYDVLVCKLCVLLHAYYGNDVITIIGFDDQGLVAEHAGILFGASRCNVLLSFTLAAAIMMGLLMIVF